MIKGFVNTGGIYAPDTVSVSLVRYPGGEGTRPTQIMRLSGTGDVSLRTSWEEIDEQAATEPTLRLHYTEALALSEALSGLFHGTGEYRALRADYEAERKRVDTLIGLLGGAAKRWAE